jgi:plasmid replication initiation protein
LGTEAGRFRVTTGAYSGMGMMIATLPYKHFDLKKHVAAIHSANKLSLIQRKIANALLFNAYHELSEQQEHQIHIRVLCELIGYNSNELNAIKRALVSLISTVVEWNLVDKERLENAGTWNASAIIADASISGSVCTYSYSHKMRQLLFRPEMYGRLNMQVQARFNSSYGLVLYENCVRYQNIQETPWFDIALFRKLMGVDEGKYAVFKDFRKRVIDIALKEINEYSGLSVNYLLKKVGRTPVAIKFSVVPNSQTTIASASPIEDVLQHDFSFSRQQAISAIADFGEAYIEEKVALVKNSASYKKKSIQHLAGYMQSALTQNYKDPKTASAKTNMPPPEMPQPLPKKHSHDDQQVQKQRLENFYELTLDEQEHYFSLFTKSIKNTIYETLFVRDQLNNTIVARKFTQFLKKQYSCKSVESNPKIL